MNVQDWDTQVELARTAVETAFQVADEMADRLEQLEERLTAVDPAYPYAKHLAETIFAHGKFNVPEWKVLDDTLGVLTQIDNMVASLRDKPDPAAIREAALREAAVACDIWPPDEWHTHTKSGYIFAAEECQRNILALIGEKK